MRQPRTEDERARFDGIRHVFADSIAPVVTAGQVTTWSGSYDISPSLRLESAPGHPPGSSVLWLRDGTGAVFVGDLVHTPAQLARPDDACAFDLDATPARVSRRRVLAEAARSSAWVFPAHFAGHGAVAIAPQQNGFQVQGWAALEEI